MLKRFIEQQKAICAVFLEDRDARQFMLSDVHYTIVEENDCLPSPFPAHDAFTGAVLVPTSHLIIITPPLTGVFAGLPSDEISVAEEHLDTMIRLKEAFYLDPWLKLCISR